MRSRRRDQAFHYTRDYSNFEVKIMIGMRSQVDFDPAKAEVMRTRTQIAVNFGRCFHVFRQSFVFIG